MLYTVICWVDSQGVSANSPNKNHKAWNHVGKSIKVWKLIWVAIEVDYGVFVFILGWVFQHVVFSVTWNGFLESETSSQTCLWSFICFFFEAEPPQKRQKKNHLLNLIRWDSVLGNLFGSSVHPSVFRSWNSFLWDSRGFRQVSLAGSHPWWLPGGLRRFWSIGWIAGDRLGKKTLVFSRVFMSLWRPDKDRQTGENSAAEAWKRD